VQTRSFVIVPCDDCLDDTVAAVVAYDRLMADYLILVTADDYDDRN